MQHRRGPAGLLIFKHGQALRGVCPNGLEVFILARPNLGNLMTVDISVIATIEREMIVTVEFLAKGKPRNVS